MRDTTLNPDEVLDNEQFVYLADAVADYLSDVTGYCVKSLSIGINVTYSLDTSDEEDEQ
jgi:hypothetical protein